MNCIFDSYLFFSFGFSCSPQKLTTGKQITYAKKSLTESTEDMGQSHGIIESCRLGKNCQDHGVKASTDKSNTKLCHLVPLYMSFKFLGDGDSVISLGSLFQHLTSFLVKKFLLIPNLDPPWHSLRPFSLSRSPPGYNLLLESFRE